LQALALIIGPSRRPALERRLHSFREGRRTRHSNVLQTTASSLRLAQLDDAEAIDCLMKESIQGAFPLLYDEEQTASSMRYISAVDRMLVEDGTYFVHVRGQILIGGTGGLAAPPRFMNPCDAAMSC